MKITKKMPIREVREEEVDLGKKGEFILVTLESAVKGYRFGRLGGITKVKEKGRETKSFLKFDGESCNLSFYEAFGLEFPRLLARKPGDYLTYFNHSKEYLSARTVGSVVSGLDNIVSFLENHPDQKYRGHVDLIRRVAEDRK